MGYDDLVAELGTPSWNSGAEDWLGRQIRYDDKKNLFYTGTELCGSGRRSFRCAVCHNKYEAVRCGCRLLILQRCLG